MTCKLPDQVCFTVHPKHWFINRCFAWLGRNRRLEDFEATIGSAVAFIYAASAMLLIKALGSLHMS